MKIEPLRFLNFSSCFSTLDGERCERTFYGSGRFTCAFQRMSSPESFSIHLRFSSVIFYFRLSARTKSLKLSAISRSYFTFGGANQYGQNCFSLNALPKLARMQSECTLKATSPCFCLILAPHLILTLN